MAAHGYFDFGDKRLEAADLHCHLIGGGSTGDQVGAAGCRHVVVARSAFVAGFRGCHARIGHELHGLRSVTVATMWQASTWAKVVGLKASVETGHAAERESTHASHDVSSHLRSVFWRGCFQPFQP